MNSVPFLSQDGAWVLEIEGGGGRARVNETTIFLCVSIKRSQEWY